MKTVSAATLKARLVHYLAAAKVEPIVIQKQEGPIAVLISFEEYARFLASEQDYWQQRARGAEKSGYIGTAKSAELLKAGLNDKS